jgi:hypothetical protein
MRRWQWLLGVSFGTAALIAACGGTSSNGNDNNKDAGSADTSVADTAPAVDTGTDAGEDVDVPSCDTDANLSTLAPPDAALGDAGGSVGKCLACTRTSCSTEVSDCQSDCDCTSTAACLFDCLSQGSSPITCAGQCTGGGIPQGATQGLLVCVVGSCADECNAHFGPQDAGPKDTGAADAIADAPADGG